MDDVRPKKVTSVHITVTLTKGRPKLRWTDKIHKDLKEIGIYKELAEDRLAWHIAIKPLTNTNRCVQPKNMKEAC